MAQDSQKGSELSQIAIGISCIVLGFGLLAIAFLASSSSSRVAGGFADLAPLMYGAGAVLGLAGIVVASLGVKARKSSRTGAHPSVRRPPPS